MLQQFIKNRIKSLYYGFQDPLWSGFYQFSEFILPSCPSFPVPWKCQVLSYVRLFALAVLYSQSVIPPRSSGWLLFTSRFGSNVNLVKPLSSLHPIQNSVPFSTLLLISNSHYYCIIFIHCNYYYQKLFFFCLFLVICYGRDIIHLHSCTLVPL